MIEGYVSSGVGTEINRHKRSIRRLIEAIGKGENYFPFLITNGSRTYWYFLPIRSKNMGKKYIKEVNRIIVWSPKYQKSLKQEDIELFQDYKKRWEEKVGIELKTNVLDYYKPLDSLIDLALQKWLERI
ncbi:MAG: hypothetical protein QNJ68_00675 [Microcoleaceae cyanobacterium MO_207.B10]|nr:hypothetical protein [Microcoleaceae cyanobacterium MO_207.B10]